MKQSLLKDFNLPKYLKGKSYADAADAISKKFEGRNDKVSLETKEELLGRLASAQEHTKQLEGISQSNEFMPGGFLASLGGTMGATGAMAAAAGPVGIAASTLAPLALDGIKAGVDAIFGPSKDDMYHEKIDAIKADNAHLRSDFGYGGKTNDYPTGGLMESLRFLSEPGINALTNPKVKGMKFGLTGGMAPGELGRRGPTATPTTLPSKGSLLDSLFSGRDAGTIGAGALRFAPVVSNLAQSANLKQRVTPRGTRMRGQYEEQPFDINRLTNEINQQNVSGAMAEASGGDLGALRRNVLAGNLNKLKALSGATTQADQINRGDRQFGFQNKFRRDIFNTQMDERYLDRAAQDEAAFDTARSGFQSAMAESLGAIGKEAQQKKQMEKMFGYDWLGDYIKKSISG